MGETGRKTAKQQVAVEPSYTPQQLFNTLVIREGEEQPRMQFQNLTANRQKVHNLVIQVAPSLAVVFRTQPNRSSCLLSVVTAGTNGPEPTALITFADGAPEDPKEYNGSNSAD